MPQSQIWREPERARNDDYKPRSFSNKSSHDARQGSSRASAHDSRQEDQRASFAIAESRRIYVGNLLYHVKPADVETLFANAADGYVIERIAMSLDPFTGRNPSYCFVELADSAQADRAMTRLNGTLVFGRPVKIKPCVPKSGGPGPAGLPPSRWEMNDAPGHWKGVSSQGRRLYVGGLPKPDNQGSAATQIRELFGDFNVEAISKVISPHPSVRGKRGNHYYAFVDLPSAGEADRAERALHGKSAFGGSLRVSKAKGDSWKVDERFYEGDPKGGRNSSAEGVSVEGGTGRLAQRICT